jgi:hypothetical protein
MRSLKSSSAVSLSYLAATALQLPFPVPLEMADQMSESHFIGLILGLCLGDALGFCGRDKARLARNRVIK